MKWKSIQCSFTMEGQKMSMIFRPPAVPLVTIDPYFNIWSMADNLYDDDSRHWTGKRHSMTGIIMIDNKPFRFMGKNRNIPVIEQTNLEVQAMSSIYTFEGNGIKLKVDFTSPLLLDDLHILSRPASYITFSIKAVDGKAHNVKLYFDVSGELCVDTPEQSVIGGRKDIDEQLDVVFMGSEKQEVLKKWGDDLRIDWGYLYVTVPKTFDVRTSIGSSSKVTEAFIRTGSIPENNDIHFPCNVQECNPVMSVFWNFKNVHSDKVSSFITLAYDDIYSIEYFHDKLAAYWKRNGLSAEEMLCDAVKEYNEIMKKCMNFNYDLTEAGVRAGGEKYANILNISYRQAISAHKLVTDQDGKLLFFSKECFSNGCIATVDVSYPSIPLFLLYNTDLIKGMLRPIFKYANMKEWTYSFAPHDVGCYPIANGQVYADNKIEGQMPVEECGNMLIMTAAVCKREKQADFALENWELLTRWADYLVQNGMDPGNQLCTDDFAGHLAHNANLSIKAILGIASYSILCNMLGMKDKADYYMNIVKDMAVNWQQMAVEQSHTKLTFAYKDTWSLKYNLIWDDIFETNLFTKELKQAEVEYYISKQNKYGIPLDCRETYTKADWLVWCAALSDRKENFEKIITPLWNFLNETSSRVPFTDWYDTVKGMQKQFQCRSVVGGIFIKLLVKDHMLS